MCFNANKLFTVPKTSKAYGLFVKQINRLERQDLLILDDFGLKALDTLNSHSFVEINQDRHGKRTTVIASQLLVGAWHEINNRRTDHCRCDFRLTGKFCSSN